MRFFNALFGTLTAGLLAATLTLTAAAWLDRPDPDRAHLASADEAPALVVRQ